MMLPKLESSMGATMSQEVETMLQSIHGLLDDNVGHIKSHVNSVESNVKQTIKEEKNEEIGLLYQKLEKKELRIKELTEENAG